MENNIEVKSGKYHGKMNAFKGEIANDLKEGFEKFKGANG